MNMINPMVIDVETLSSRWSLEKEFTELIHINPWMVLCLTINQVYPCQSCVRCLLTWGTKDISGGVRPPSPPRHGHYGAGGADTRARPAPLTGEDEGCRVSLHQVRTSSRHDTFHRARARGSYLSSFYFIMNFISPHVFKRAFAYLLLSLLGFRVGSSLFRDPIR